MFLWMQEPPVPLFGHLHKIGISKKKSFGPFSDIHQIHPLGKKYCFERLTKFVVYSLEMKACRSVLAKRWSLYRCQNSWTMHVFDGINWISVFENPHTDVFPNCPLDAHRPANPSVPGRSLRIPTSKTLDATTRGNGGRMIANYVGGTAFTEIRLHCTENTSGLTWSLDLGFPEPWTNVQHGLSVGCRSSKPGPSFLLKRKRGTKKKHSGPR